MSYLVQSLMAEDIGLRARVAACVATLGVVDAWEWAHVQRWRLSAQPGWVDGYSAAAEDPGMDEGGITDDMILGAVRSLLGIVPEPEEDLAEPEELEPDPDPEPEPEPDEPDEPEESEPDPEPEEDLESPAE